MREKRRKYIVTPVLLAHYRDAALTNSKALLAESRLLLEHGHRARAYFLAVAGMEEIGKAVLAHDGIGRNLADPAVQHRLRLNFEDHSQKITHAFLPWLLNTPDLREQVMEYVNTMINVKNGRESSMYVDVHNDDAEVVLPADVVREVAAKNCLDLASAVLVHALPYVTHLPPRKRSRAEDLLFSLSQSTFQKMTNTADFWEYYMSRMRLGDMEFETAACEYHRAFFTQKRAFLPASTNDA